MDLTRLERDVFPVWLLPPIPSRLIPLITTFLQSCISVQPYEGLESGPARRRFAAQDLDDTWSGEGWLSFPWNKCNVRTSKHTSSYNPDLSSFRPHLPAYPRSESPNLHSPEANTNTSCHLLYGRERLARTLATDKELGNWEYEVPGHLPTRCPIFILAARQLEAGDTLRLWSHTPFANVTRANRVQSWRPESHLDVTPVLYIDEPKDRRVCTRHT